MGAEQRLHSINIMYGIPVVAGYKRAGWSHAGSPVDSWKIPAIHRSINSSGDRQYNTFIHLYTLHHCCWERYGSLTHSWQSISFSFFKTESLTTFSFKKAVKTILQLEHCIQYVPSCVIFMAILTEENGQCFYLQLCNRIHKHCSMSVTLAKNMAGDGILVICWLKSSDRDMHIC